MMDTTQQSRDVDGRRIAYHDVGKGPVLVLLHGGGPGASGMSNYGRNIDALAERFRVIVPDMPGYRVSAKKLSRDDTFGDLASGIGGLLDALGVERAHLCGNSLGGACALRLALDRPGLVDRLVLMGPGGVDTTRSLPTKGLRALLDYYKGTGPSRDKLRRFLGTYLVHDAGAISDEMVEARYQASIDPEVVASPPLRAPAGLKAALRMDFTRDRRLHSLETPTLILWGRDDRVNRPSGARSLARLLPNADTYIFANTGHWVQWERASEFNAVVAGFLGAGGGHA